MTASSRPVPDPRPRGDRQRLAEALREDGESRRHLATRSRQVEQAEARGARVLTYYTDAPDQSHALEYEVYFATGDPGEAPEILVARLAGCDHRAPTANEAERWDRWFDDRLRERGDEWLRVASHVRQRALA